MIAIGIGNAGIKIALMFDKKALLISTAIQDTKNYRDFNVFEVSKEGASKRFKLGSELWEKNNDRLNIILSEIENEKIILFSSFGGGSGSSSLKPISDILLKKNNKVLIIGILPYKGESNPPLANSVQSISSLFPILNDITIMIFDNTKLIKEHNGDWNIINNFIVKRVDYMINLLTKFNSNGYSPITIDQSELESVVFGGGFLDFSETFIEEKAPKFEYGKMDKNTKNCLIAMFVDKSIIEKENLESYHKILSTIVTKMSRKIPNSRMIPGILRADINRSNSVDKEIKDRAYFVIASGLNADNYIIKLEKLRDIAIDKAVAFNTKIKTSNVLGNKDRRILDV